MNGLGPLQKRCRRAFIANPGSTLTTGFLVSWCYPRLVGKAQNNHRRYSSDDFIDPGGPTHADVSPRAKRPLISH